MFFKRDPSRSRDKPGAGTIANNGKVLLPTFTLYEQICRFYLAFLAKHRADDINHLFTALEKGV